MSKKTLQKTLLFIVISVSLLGLLSYAAARLSRIPAPPALLALALEWEPPSGSYKFFDSSEVQIAPPPDSVDTQNLPEQLQALASQIAWRDGQTIDFAQFLKATHTNALLVLHRGALVFESYPRGAQRDTVFPSFSLAKSMLSDLVGVALNEGKIGSLDDPVSLYLPELPARFSKLRVYDLLHMRSGIHVDERYDSVFSKIAYMYITTDLRRFVRELETVAYTPQQGFEYRSVDYLLLGMLLSAVTGETLSHYLQQKIWQPMGAQYAASWSIDSDRHQVEKSFCCVNARAIDFARYGLLHLRKGRVGERQILPADWMQKPEATGHADDHFDYGRGWWLPRLNGAGDARDYTAIGIHGQYVYIDPVSDTVIVKLSDHGAEQDEALTVAAFRSMVAALEKGTH
jgi:CubicO group peptidase (beta-lactamase class C family)